VPLLSGAPFGGSNGGSGFVFTGSRKRDRVIGSCGLALPLSGPRRPGYAST